MTNMKWVFSAHTCARTCRHMCVAFGLPCGEYVREVVLLGAPGCVQAVVTEYRQQQQHQSGSGEERSGAMPRRFPLRGWRKGRKRETERAGWHERVVPPVGRRTFYPDKEGWCPLILRWLSNVEKKVGEKKQPLENIIAWVQENGYVWTAGGGEMVYKVDWRDEKEKDGVNLLGLVFAVSPSVR